MVFFVPTSILSTISIRQGPVERIVPGTNHRHLGHLYQHCIESHTLRIVFSFSQKRKYWNLAVSQDPKIGNSNYMVCIWLRINCWLIPSWNNSMSTQEHLHFTPIGIGSLTEVETVKEMPTTVENISFEIHVMQYSKWWIQRKWDTITT